MAGGVDNIIAAGASNVCGGGEKRKRRHAGGGKDEEAAAYREEQAKACEKRLGSSSKAAGENTFVLFISAYHRLKYRSNGLLKTLRAGMQSGL
jgi:hypothetical protein